MGRNLASVIGGAVGGRWKDGSTKAPLVQVHQGRWVMGAAGIVGLGAAFSYSSFVIPHPPPWGSQGAPHSPTTTFLPFCTYMPRVGLLTRWPLRL